MDSNWQAIVLVVIMLACTPAMASDASSTAEASKPVKKNLEDEFDLDFLNQRLIDKSERTRALGMGRLSPGIYSVNVEINSNNKGVLDIRFQKKANEMNATPCFTVKDLAIFKLKPQYITRSAQALLFAADSQTSAATAPSESCLSIEEIVEQGTYEYDPSALILRLTVAQAAIDEGVTEVFSVDAFTEGANAGFLNYSVSAFRAYGGPTRGYSRFADFNAGMNVAGWQIRQQSTYSDSQSYANATLGDLSARKIFKDLQLSAAFGNISSQTPLMSGVRIKGLSLYSEEGLIPPAERTYNPSIKGVARTNARVQARQNGVLFLERNVPPGAFEFGNIRPPNSVGDIEIVITEADGTQQVSAVPYANVLAKLKPGTYRYIFNAGHYSDGLGNDKLLVQANLRYGLSAGITAAFDLLQSQEYQSVATQADFENILGRQLVNLQIAQAAVSGNRTEYSLRYQDRLQITKNFSLSYNLNYRSNGFLEPWQALTRNDYLNQSYYPPLKQSQTLSAALDMGRWGAIGLTGSVLENWTPDSGAESLQLSYSKSILGANLNLALGTSAGYLAGAKAMRPFSGFLSLQIPVTLGPGRGAVSASVSTQDKSLLSQSLNYQSTSDHGLSYSIGTSRDQQAQANNGSIQAEHAWGIGSASFSQTSNGDQQFGLGNSGSLVYYRGAVFAAQTLGDTFAIVEVPGGGGVRVAGQSGRIGKNGLGVASYLSPYLANQVQLDLQDAPIELELASNSESVAPVAGAIAYLKYESISGKPLLIDFERKNGQKIPIGAEVLDDQNYALGLVGQASRSLVRVKKASGALKVIWGDKANESCMAYFRLSEQDKPTLAGLFKLKLQCE